MSLRKLGIAVGTAALFATGLWSGIGSAGWTSSDAGAIGLTAKLVATKEVPKPKGVRANAGGTFAGGLTRRGTGGTLAWKLTFHDLTGKATGAHIHLAKSGRPGPVAVPLCGPCRSGMKGSAKVNAKTVRALLNGGAYVNVHTTKNAGGEIRGQIRKGGSAVRPPTTSTTTSTETTTTTYGDPGYPP